MSEDDGCEDGTKGDHPDLEFLSTDPANAQVTTRSQYETSLTPIETFYVRNHYPTPAIDASGWDLSITGSVDEELSLSIAELKRRFPTASVVTTMECAGNGRTGFSPPSDGHQWAFGAVSTARWTGVPLAALLDAAGATPDADLWVTVIGADAPAGDPVFARSLPMAKLREDCLLAYGMNGEALPAEHGFPARVIVPGWYGNNSVKWVRRLHVMETMIHGEEWEQYTTWQQRRYRLLPKDEEPIERADIDVFDSREQMTADGIRHPYLYDKFVNSLIVAPTAGVVTPDGGAVTIRGLAWAGDETVTGVEVSTDGGQTWAEAALVGPDPDRFAWQRFRYEWEPEPGEHTLVSRATDDRGRSQPAVTSDPDERLLRITDDKFPWNQRGYGNNAYATNGVDVAVEPS